MDMELQKTADRQKEQKQCRKNYHSSLKIQYRGIMSKTEWYRQKTDMWVSLAEEGHQNQVLLPQTEMRSKWKDPTCETRDRDC